MRLNIRHLAVLTAAAIAASGAAYALEGGLRTPPAKEIPVPTADVSTAAQALIGAPLQGVWNDHPKDAAAWKAWVKTRSDGLAATLPALREKFGVTVEATKIGGVNAFIVTPNNIPTQTRTGCSCMCTAVATCCSPASPARAKRS